MGTGKRLLGLTQMTLLLLAKAIARGSAWCSRWSLMLTKSHGGDAKPLLWMLGHTGATLQERDSGLGEYIAFITSVKAVCSDINTILKNGQVKRVSVSSLGQPIRKMCKGTSGPWWLSLPTFWAKFVFFFFSRICHLNLTKRVWDQICWVCLINCFHQNSKLQDETA